MSAIFCASLVACGDGDDGSGSSEKVVITYYIREDSAPLTVKVKKYEEYKFSLNSLKRNHYTFAGMYEGPNGSGSMIVDAKGKSTTVFMDDTTLYCYWTPSSYTLEFDAVDGVLDDAEKTKSVQYGSNVGLLPAPTLEGYNFDGWYIGLDRISNGSEVISGKEVLLETNYSFPESGNIVLTAKYSIKEYTVTFNYNDGRVENGTIKIEHGQPIPSDRYPQEDTGSKLLYAWSTSTNSVVAFTGTVTEDITLYAFWKNYKVFQFYDGIKSTSDTKKVFQNEPLTLDPLSNRDGYTFRGWYNNTLGNGDPITTVTYGSGSIKYYASWSINTYQITLNANGGACPPDPISYTIESEDFDLPVPERENYTFLGWCKKSDLSDAPITKIVKGTYELTQLYAKYKGETKTLILNACQGYVSQTRKLVEFGKTFSLPVPTLAEHVFIGWYDGEDSSANKITDSNGNGLAPLGFKPAETTLYAHYMKKLHVNVNVNLEPAGKTTVKEYYLEGDKVDLTATLNTGYNFLGWYQDGELVNDQLEYKFTMGATDTTLELKYEAKKYTVTLVPGDGASCTESSDEVTFGESYNLVVPTKQDYTFIGWKLGDKVITNTEGVSKAVWDYDGDVSLYAYFVIVEPNTIPVYDESTLLGMADNPSATYCLYSDVDMTGVTWTPFDFSGTFKGNGLSIKNLTVTSSSGALGVFKKLTGNISDVNFENLTVKSTSYNLVNVGGVCAEMTGGTIDKVTVSGSVTGDYCRLGGIVGYMTGGTLSNSTNKADLKTDTYETSNVFVGGLVGYQTGGTVTTCINYGKVESKRYTGGVIGYATTTSFVDLFNYGEVKGDYIAGGVIACFEKAGGYTISTKLTNYGKVSGKEQVGGVFGRFYDGWDQGYNGKENLLKLSNFSNNGTINGNNYVGGVIGYLNAQTWGGGGNGSVKVTITNINNVGDVTGKTYVGGLFGYAYSDTGNSSIENCASTADIKAEAFIGGLAGKLENIKLISCENEFSTVTATGYVLDGNTYYGYVGGYVGYGYYVEDCHNAVEIKYNEQGMYVGGIAGRTLARVVNCSNTADVIAEKSNNVGGIVGEIACNGGYEIAQLSNSGTIKGKDVVGGVIGRLPITGSKVIMVLFTP